MFVGLDRKLNQKLSTLKQEIEDYKKTENAIQAFLGKKGYPQAIVAYDPKEGSVMIETPSKVFANELTMRLGDIAAALKQEGIQLRKIIIK